MPGLTWGAACEPWEWSKYAGLDVGAGLGGTEQDLGALVDRNLSIAIRRETLWSIDALIPYSTGQMIAWIKLNNSN